jgi:hypothetical protein
MEENISKSIQCAGIQKIHKLLKFNNKQIIQLIGVEKIFAKEDLSVVSKYIERCVVSAKQNPSERQLHTRQDARNKKQVTSIGEHVQKQGPSHTTNGCKLALPLWKTPWQFFKLAY